MIITGLYLTTFLLDVVARAAEGEDTLPDWPEAAQVRLGVGAGLLGVALVLGVTILPGEMATRLDGTQSFVRAMGIFGTSPALAPSFADALDGHRGLGLSLAVLLLAQGYAPMALLLAALGAGWRGLDPRLVLPAIRRAGAAYVLVCGVLTLSLLVHALVVVVFAESRCSVCCWATSSRSGSWWRRCGCSACCTGPAPSACKSNRAASAGV